MASRPVPSGRTVPVIGAIALALAVLLPVVAGAQQVTGPAVPPGGAGVQWWQGLAFVGAVSALMLVDNAGTDLLMAHQSPAGKGVAKGFRQMGEPEVWAVATLGTTAFGLLTGNPRVAGAGMRMTAAVGLAGLTTHGLKQVFGRDRPSLTDSDHLDLFGEGHSLPSGHATVAFALAASAADEIGSPLATVLLYGAATGTALSRVYDRRHWLSDVALGAAIGITSAKFVNGRWSVFGLRAPKLLVSAGGVGVSIPLPQ